MYAWGFGTPSKDGKKITGSATGTDYDTATVTVKDYWTEMQAKYAGDYQSMSGTELANTDLFTFLWKELGDKTGEFQKGVNTGDSAANIAGIVKTGDNTLRVSMTKYDSSSIYQLALPVAPLHYYGSKDAYNYDNNQFGFTKGDLSGMKEKNTAPLGAGPYVFKSYEKGVVTFTANDSYFEGAPKIKNLLFKETLEADKLSGVTSGAFDISDPTLSSAVLDSIKKDNSNGDITGDSITTSLVDNLGYGYLGINAKNVSVGGNPSSDASKDLRKAFATLFAVYRDTVIQSYYGEMASVIQYPISNTSWAAPRPTDDGYALAYTKDVDKKDIYTQDMTEQQKYEAALKASIGFFKAAGYTWDDSKKTFTAAPDGAELTYEIIIPGGGSGDHPAYGILTAVKEALASIGITLEINDPSDGNELWNSINAGTVQLWVAAWQATPDPDMYQIYNSANVVENNGGTKSNNYHIQDTTLDDLIMKARESADQSYRKSVYKECLGIILDWGVEVPLYQRKNAIIFSTSRVNMDTVTPDITPFYGWASEIQNMEMN
jgi:peptide/nickel transport system substrate-binding protein